MQEIPETQTETTSYRRWLLGLALGMLAALLLLPATRVLLWDQFRLQLTRSAPRKQAAPDYREVAARHPGDYPLQLAAAMQACMGRPSQGPVGDISPLTELRTRFGDSPSLLANLLRLMNLKTGHPDRAENYLLMGNKVPDRPRPRPLEKAEIDRWLDYDEAAARGEQLDPRNAYFPFMRSIGLFVLRRDSQALAAIERAAALTSWDEFVQDEQRGRWRAEELQSGPLTARRRAMATASILLPHYSRFRSSARIATYAAVKAEAAGRPEDGLKIRRSVARCGSLMRVHSRYFIGSLVGVGVTDVSFQLPGGAAPATYADRERGDARRERRIRTYEAYLTRIGHPEEAAWVRSEARAQRQVGDLATLYFSHEGRGPTAEPIEKLHRWWAAGHLILANLVWLLLLGALASFRGLVTWSRSARPLPWSVPAAGLAFLACIAGTFGFSTSPSVPGRDYLVVAAYALVVTLVTYTAVCRRGDLWGLITAFAAMVGGLWAVTTLAAWLAAPVDQMLSWRIELNLNASPPPDTDWLAAPGLLPAATLVAPAVTGLILAICSLILRVPVATGLVRGFRAAAVPLACILVLSYGGCVLMTARHEQQVNRLLTAAMEHEGRHLAASAGREWPGRTP